MGKSNCPTPPSARKKPGLKWNVKVALMGASAPCQADTTRLLFSPRAADCIISSLQNAAESESLRGGGWEGGVAVGGGRNVKKKTEGERRLEESLNQETERSRCKDEKRRSEGPRGFGVYV